VADPLFPFELDGVTVLSESEIRYEGQTWTATRGPLRGQFTLRPGWLRQGASIDDESEGELWVSSAGETLEPSVGPAWAGSVYVPTPAYVREQMIRRRAGLPVRERRWLAVPGEQPKC
jgi:hypothetical protein